MSYKVTTTVEVDPKRIQDLICGAFEGGSNYWLGNGRVELIRPKYSELPQDDVVWYGNSKLNVFGVPDFDVTLVTEDGVKHLNAETVQKGLELMAEKHAEHFNDFITENDDAETADIFLQLCLFGEIVYG